MRHVVRPQELEWNVFTRKEALRAGLTDTQLGGPGWLRLLRGVYADSRMKRDHGLRLRAALRVLPAYAVVAGPSAAWIHGCGLASLVDPVDVLVPRDKQFGPIQRIRVHSSVYPLLSGDVREINGGHVTDPYRTAWDIGCWLPIKQSVPYLDAMLRNRAVSRAALLGSVADRPNIRGSRRAFTAIGIADARAESFAESSLRAQLHVAGLATPEVQYEIRDEGGFVARVDLAWPEKRVVLEYEGSYHAAAKQMAADRFRLSRIAAAGWRVVFATGRHVYGDAMPELVRDLRGMLA